MLLLGPYRSSPIICDLVHYSRALGKNMNPTRIERMTLWNFSLLESHALPLRHGFTFCLPTKSNNTKYKDFCSHRTNYRNIIKSFNRCLRWDCLSSDVYGQREYSQSQINGDFLSVMMEMQGYDNELDDPSMVYNRRNRDEWEHI